MLLALSGKGARRWLLAIVTALTALIAALITPEARAQDKDGKTIAIHIEGTDADKVREMIVKMVPEGVAVMDKATFSASLRKSGLTTGTMGFSFTSPTMRKTVINITRKSVQRDKLAGALMGKVRAGRTGNELVVVFVEDADALALDTTVALKGNAAAQEIVLKDALGPTLDALAPPKVEPEPEPEPDPKPKPKGDDDEEEEEEEEDDDEEGDWEENRPGHDLFNIFLGVEFGGRFFSYSDSPANTANLRTYDVFGVPGISVGGEVYPAATLGIPFVSDVGITVSYMHAFGLDSQSEDGRFAFGTNWNRFMAGLRFRFPFLDDERPFVIAADVKFGFMNFTFDAENPESEAIKNEIATVEYLFVRGGIDARLPIVSWFAVMPSFGFVGPIESRDPADLTGPVYNRFKEPSVLAIDAGLMLAFVVGAGIEIRGGAEYTRFFSSFAPVPGDAYVAGGALDQYVALRVGGAYVF